MHSLQIAQSSNTVKPSDMEKDVKVEPRSDVKRFSGCYNCQNDGHLAKKFPEPKKPIICNRCRKEGHIRRSCPQLSNAETSKETKATGNKDKAKICAVAEKQVPVPAGAKYFKKVLVNEVESPGFIDPGTSDCIIRERDAVEIVGQVDQSEAELYGFGDESDKDVKLIKTGLHQQL